MDSSSERSSAINIVFVLFIAGGVLFAGFTGHMHDITDASFESAKSAVSLAISLIGIMAFWLGMVRVLEAGGLMYSIARAVRPLMVRLFPDVPADHPAMSAMILNMSANMLGLGNAATPLGIKAMVELNKLNPIPGTATNAMCLFLAINTSSVTLLPLGVIGVRAAAGAAQPAAIFLPTLAATIISTLVGVCAALTLALRDKAYQPPKRRSSASADEEIELVVEQEDFSHLRTGQHSLHPYLGWSLIILFGAAAGYRAMLAQDLLDFLINELMTFWLMPALMLLIIAYGVARGVKIYEAVTEGAKQGFDIAVRIIPFLVAILVAIAMFRASGAMALLAGLLNPITGIIFMPADVLPMALVRPLSGSGAFGIMSDLVAQDPNSYSAYLASTMQGSTETTFYVLAVYFGAVGITRIRHALVAALLADFAGIIASCLMCRLLWSGAGS
ncbi:MAG: hypothetical protein KDD66_02255 [Bdellovibrionales bacterium]|nr:hypothetical protein [Bdellovibrionales bacterium]